MSLETPKDLQRLRQAFAAGGPENGPCPSNESIFAAAGGDLTNDESALGEILDHVATCSACTESWRLAVEIRRELEGGAAAADAPPGGRVIAGDFRREKARSAGLRRWSLPLGLVAAVLLVTIGLQLLPKAPPVDPALRGAAELRIEDVSPPLERERPVLRWRLVPETAGAIFEVRVMSEDLELLAQRDALAAGELPTGELALPAERLGKIPAGGWLLWQVRASLPDGRQVDSETFRSRLP